MLRRVVVVFAALLVLTQPPLVHAVQKGYPAKVTALQNHKYVDALLSGIKGAKSEIVGCFFLFKVSGKHGGLPQKIVEELVAARKRGVDVTIELEQDAGGKGTVYEQNRVAARILADAGVKVRFDAPKTTTHVKALVIDGRYVYLGSHNLTQSALKYNNELSVMIDSADFAAEVLGYLDSL